MKHTIVLFLLFCGATLCHAVGGFSEIKMEYPTYFAEIVSPGSLMIRKAPGGELIFRELFSAFQKNGKPFWEYHSRNGWEIHSDMEKRIFTYTHETPGKVHFVKKVTLLPQIIKVEYYFTNLSGEPLNAAEFSILLPSALFGGSSYRFNNGQIEGTLPAVETPSAGQVLTKGLTRGEIAQYHFRFRGCQGTLKDERKSRWSRNSFRLMGVRGGKAFIQGKEIFFGIEIKMPMQSDKSADLMEVMQVVKYTPVDIRSAANMGFQENAVANDGKGGWTDEGEGSNDLRNLPLGRQQFGGIPFSILDPVTNNGKSCIVLANSAKQHLPASVEIPINMNARSLYFLHGSAWGRKGEKIGGYCINYSDGNNENIDLIIDQNICDWWMPRELTESVIGWIGACPRRSPIGLTILGWNNPTPEKMIRSISFYSNRSLGMPMLVGITSSNQQVALVRQAQKEKRTDLTGWKPFSVTEKPLPTDNNALDGSSEVRKHAPAGKYGFVQTCNGRFEFENRRRAKFFGLALVGGACFPTPENAETMARHLAELGCNIVRLHLYDNNSFTPANKPRINIFGEKMNSSELSPERMKQLDYFFAKLKEQGIYIYLDLDSARVYTEQDGVEVGKKDKFGNSIENRGLYFDPATVAARKKFARDLLLHHNPYTRLRYVEEPAIALIGLANENSVFLFDVWRKLDGSYLQKYTQLWNRWLAQRYGNSTILRKNWGCELALDESIEKSSVKAVLPVGMPLGNWGGKDSPRLTDGTIFAYELQTQSNREMYDYLRSLGVKIPITGSQPLFLNPPDLKSTADLDFVDLHPYFFGVRPMLQGDIPDYDTVTQIALGRVKNKPLTVTEWNYHNKDIFPWRNDGPVFVAAYAALQDIDCLIAHSYSGTSRPRSRIEWNQEFHNDPVFIGQWPMASNVFLRRDVAPARETLLAAVYDDRNVFLREKSQPSIGFNAFISRVYSKFDGTVDERIAAPRFDRELISDTGELCWRRNEAVFFLNTVRTQAVIGRLDRAKNNPNAILEVTSHSVHPQSIVLSAMDGKGIPDSDLLLLTACGRCENTDMIWDASCCKAIDRGKAPIMIEPVRAGIRLKKLVVPEQYMVSALKNDGTTLQEVASHVENGELCFSLDADTIFYRILRKK